MEEIQLASSGPKTTVLIVSHNCAEALRRCLDSLLRTTDRQAVEIIVVDKGSRDGSAQLDSEFPGTTFLRLPRNFGYTKAANIGTRTGAGDYLLLLDPHVEVTPGALAPLTAILDSDEEAAAACPLLVDESGRPLSRCRKIPAGSDLLDAWKKGAAGGSAPSDLSGDSVVVEFPPKAAVLVRKQFLRGMNYLDERYGEHGADAELFFQIRHAGRKVRLLPGVRVLYRPEEPELPPDARAQLSADEALAAAAYAGKHGGVFAGLGIRLLAILHVLIKLLAFQSFGYQMSRLLALAGGQKIDGSQSAI
jgi:GT2 family glycosyltransferase